MRPQFSRRMKVSGLIFCLLLFLPWSLMAQDNDTRKRIYLQDGSVFVGKIKQYNTGGVVEIELENGQVLEVQESAILKMERPDQPPQAVEPVAPRPEKKKKDRPKDAFKLQKGFITYANFGFSGTVLDFNGLSVNLNAHGEFGYQFNPYLSFTLGSGIEWMVPERGEMIVPMFGTARYFPSGGKNGWQLSMAGGYGLALENRNAGIFEAEGGYLVYPAVGYYWPVSENMKVNADVGFHLQKARFEGTINGGDVVNRDITYQRITFRVGLLFQ